MSVAHEQQADTGREPVQGHVAQILNAQELVINRGSSDGVRVGMVFDVLDPKAENIADPITGEDLGSVYRPKVKVRVTAVEERLAIARTFRATRVNVGGLGIAGAGVSRLFEAPKWEARHETLKSDAAVWEDLDEEDSYVKIGDPVIEVVAEEESGARTLQAAPDGDGSS